MTRVSRLLIGILGVSISVSLVAFILLPTKGSEAESWWTPATTFSPGPFGTKALMLLLQREGFETRRLLKQEYDRVNDEAVLWILSNAPLSVSENELLKFLQRGGTIVGVPVPMTRLLKLAKLGKSETRLTRPTIETRWGVALWDDARPFTLSGLPSPDDEYAWGEKKEPIVASWNVGEGRAVFLGLPGIVLNGAIGRAQNGPFLVRLARELGDEHVFDEVNTGFGEADLWTLLTHAPYRWGLLQAALVGLVALAASGFRRLPAELMPALRRRSTQSHLDAVTGLWFKSRDPGLALEALLRVMDERARLRLRKSGDQPFVEWVSRLRPTLATRAAEAWSDAHRLCSADRRPSVGEARRAAAALRQVQEDVRRW